MAQKSKTNWFQITSFIITILSIVIGGYGLFQKNKEMKQLSGLSVARFSKTHCCSP